VAEHRIPGPLDASRGNRNVRDGTLQLRPGVTPGIVKGPVAGNASAWGLFDLDDRIGDLIDALNIAKANTFAAVKRMTGEALDELIDALLPGLLTIIAVLGITTVVGGAIGAAVGALVGAGVGAAPGAVAGVQLGLSIAGTLLTWMGLGFLLVAIGEGLGELSARVVQATSRAWNALDSANRTAEVHQAGLEFADAVALLFKIILMAIVARLTLRQTRASTEETLALLRKSRLGEQFAAWVAKNREALVRNPKLQPKPKATQSEAPIKHVETPSQVKKQAPKVEESPPPQKSKRKPKTKLKCGEYGQYGELKKKTGDNQFDRDHIPSKAALKKRAEELFGERISENQAKAIENWGSAIAIPRQAHVDVSPTYGQTAKEAAKDAKDLAGSARRDVEAMLGKIDQYDADGTCKKQYQKAAKRVLKDNEWFDERLLDLLSKHK
jgi:hypothetical protein